MLCCAAAAVAADVRDLVAVYKNPPYPIFYDVVYHSYALVPMLASPLYYSSKFSSTVLTSFITGAAGGCEAPPCAFFNTSCNVPASDHWLLVQCVAPAVQIQIFNRALPAVACLQVYQSLRTASSWQHTA